MAFSPKCIDSSDQDTFDDEEKWTQVMTSICNTEKQNHEDYIIGGVRIKFPKTAYKSQELLMSCMIEGVKKSENCLLESPTGTGKTLAILCALLAWQSRCRNKDDWGHTIDAATLQTGCTCGFMKGDPNKFIITQKCFESDYVVLQRFSYEYVEVEEKLPGNTDDTESNSPKKKKNEVKRKKILPDDQRNEYQLCRYCIRSNYKQSSVPVIYYSTRTISQVDQVVKELKSTAYSGVKMTVLAGRSTYCTNLDVTKPNLTVDDECQKLRENYSRNTLSNTKVLKECDYYQGGTKGANMYVYEDFTEAHETCKTSWDIEELKTYSRQQCGCAYYGAKILHERAEIVFCTYNYLLHAGIRGKSKISLINSVLVFDEAHNIEDLCRDVSSLTITQNYIDKTVIPAFQEALKNGKSSPIPPKISPVLDELLTLFTRFSKWIDSHSEKLVFNIKLKQEDFKQFAPEEIVSELNELGLGADNIQDLIVSCDKLEQAVLGKPNSDQLNQSFEYDDSLVTPNETMDSQSHATMNLSNQNASTCSSTAKGNGSQEIRLKFSLTIIRYLKNIVETLKLIFGHDKVLTEDYRAIILKKVTTGAFKTITFSNEFQIVCLNPAIAFKQLKNSAHSVIVTSGTLFPLESFESELDTPFAIQLSAPHVIESSQVFSTVTQWGPKDIPLHFNTFGQKFTDRQDELGRVILSVCKIVPHGVLIFFPSYSWLEQLKLRWEEFPQTWSMMQELRSLKKVYFEDSKMSKDEFKGYMKDYQANIEDKSSGGCILFAVFRGKVSEGIDFKDDQARAVLTVGIPFSNPGNANVHLKMTYNDTINKNSSRRVLSGREWYTTQAFRAMNQAFGRCVRHKNDWGSIILLEDRMNSQYYAKHLSQWVKRDLKVYSGFGDFERNLMAFVKDKDKCEVPASNQHLNLSKIINVINKSKITDVISPEAPRAPHLHPYKIETYPSPQQQLSEVATQKVTISEMETQIVVVNQSGIFPSVADITETERTSCKLQSYCKSKDILDEENSNSGFDASDLDSSQNEILGPTDDENDSDDYNNYNTLTATSTQSSSIIKRLRKSIYVSS